MNILFFTPTLVAGGAEKTIYNLLVYMKQYEPDITAYECVMHVDEGNTIPDHVFVMSNDTFAEKNKIRKAWKKIKQVSELRDLKKKLNIDICISFIPGADRINMLSDIGEKKVISIRNNPNMINYGGTVLRHIYLKQIKQVDKVVALSNTVRSSILEYFNLPEENVQTIYNPTPVIGDLQEPELCARLHGKGLKILVTAGRLTGQKGQWHLIKAYKTVLEHCNNTELLILGKGELEEQLKNCARQCGVAEHVHFLGFKENAMEYIKYSDIFVFPSVFEGLGNVLIETLSLGTPIISYDCPFGPREILAPEEKNEIAGAYHLAEYGVLVPADTNEFDLIPTAGEKELASAICRLLSDPALLAHYQKQSLLRSKDFAPKEIIQQWKRLFEELLT